MRAVKKILTLIVNTGITKVLGLATHFILATILSPEDFGVYAIVVTLSAFFLVLRNGGVQQYLLHHINDIKELTSTTYSFGLLFNVLIMMLLVVSSPVMASYYQSGILQNLLLILAASIPLSTPWYIYKTELLAQNKYDIVSKILVTSDFLKYSLTILLVWLGLGLYGMVLPLLVEGIAQSFMGWYSAKYWVKAFYLGKNDFKKILSSTKWIMLSSFAIALTKQGDYFALSFFVSKSELGLYYFSYQLIFSIIIFFITISEFIIIPVFSRNKHDKKLLSSLFQIIILFTTLVAIFIDIALFYILDDVIKFIWHGKWDSAIPIALIMLPLIPFLNIFYLSRALADALGMWKSRLWLNLINGIGIVLTATICAKQNDIITVTIGVVSFQIIFTLVQLFMIAHLAQLNKSEMFMLILNLAFACSTWFVISLDEYMSLKHNFISIFNSTIVYIIAFLILNRTIFSKISITRCKISQVTKNMA